MLEVHRSQEAGNPEQPSRRYAITKDVMSLIALLLLLLVSLSLTLTTLNEDPLWLFCIIHAPQKDRFTRRNQRLYTFNEHRIKKIYRKQGNNIHEGNRSIKNDHQQKVAHPAHKSSLLRHYHQLILPTRRSSGRKGKQNPTKELHQMTDDHNYLTGTTLDNQSLGRPEEERIERNRDERDPDLGQYTQGEMDRKIAEAFAEGGGVQVFHSRVVAQMLGPLLREERIEKNHEEHKGKLKDPSFSTTTQTVGEISMESEDPVLVRERIERNREVYKSKYKLSEAESSLLEQKRKDRQAEGKMAMDWTDQLALKQYNYECLEGKHKMKGTASLSGWLKFRYSPETMASIAATKMEEEREEEEERIRQEEEQDYGSDPELGQYTQGERDRAYERGRQDKERDRSGTMKILDPLTKMRPSTTG